jgi:hypothetical protein
MLRESRLVHNYAYAGHPRYLQHAGQAIVICLRLYNIPTQTPNPTSSG